MINSDLRIPKDFSLTVERFVEEDSTGFKPYPFDSSFAPSPMDLSSEVVFTTDSESEAFVWGIIYGMSLLTGNCRQFIEKL